MTDSVNISESYCDGEDGLKLDSIHLRYFRNYERFEYDHIDDLTIFTGRNAVGKTNIIEAIQLMTSLQSFRCTKIFQAVNWDHEEALVTARFKSSTRDLELKMNIENGKRIYTLNNKKKSIQDLKGLLPSVIFTPNDLDLVKGSHSSRRAAIDSLASQLSKNFYSIKSDYSKLVKQKNQALNDMASSSYIESIDEILVKVGVQLLSHRTIIIQKIGYLFSELYTLITDATEKAAIVYLPFWIEKGSESWVFDKNEAYDSFEKELFKRKEEERRRQKSLVGPHTDRIEFFLDGRDAVHFASQGQQRSVVLAYKLAELAVIQQTLNQRPILLLDDVMSELDDIRRTSFIDFISDDIQTFITTTNTSYFNDKMLEKAHVIHLPLQIFKGEKI